MSHPPSLSQQRAVLREMFHLFFDADRESVADAAERARKLCTLLTDPDLKARAEQYLMALEIRAAQAPPADSPRSAAGS